MTKAFYRVRIEALGYNMSQWAKVCGVNRSTILRHYKAEEAGERHKIPGPFWVILDMLEVKGAETP